MNSTNQSSNSQSPDKNIKDEQTNNYKSKEENNSEGFLEDEDQIPDYRGKGREEVDRVSKKENPEADPGD